MSVKWVNIGSGNGLVPDQAPSHYLNQCCLYFSIRPSGTENLNKKNQTLPTKWWPYCPDLNVLIIPLMMKKEHLKTLSSLHDKWMECILTLVWSNDCKRWFPGHDHKVSEQHTRERLKTTGLRHHSKLKMPFYQYKNRYWSDMMILRPSYLHNGPQMCRLNPNLENSHNTHMREEKRHMSLIWCSYNWIHFSSRMVFKVLWQIELKKKRKSLWYLTNSHSNFTEICSQESNWQ